MRDIVKKMNRAIIFWVMLGAVFFGGTLYHEEIVVHAESTVYITRTGEKYHTHKCGNGTFFASTLSTAQSMGLTPCSKCFGGSSASSSGGNTSGGSSSGKKKAVVKPIKINKKSLILVKGETTKLKIKNAKTKVKWKSSKKTVVSVSGNGKVKAKKVGKAVVTAIVGNVKKTCKITVESPELNINSVTLNIGDTKKLKLSGCSHSIRWSSSDIDVVEVKKGKITAQDAGTAIITAKTHGKKYKCKVKVNVPNISDFSLSENTVKLGNNKQHTLSVSATPEDVLGYYDISVKSSDESIVRVSFDYDGETVLLETQQMTGKAVVYVTVGNITKECQVEVEKNI